MGQKLSHAHLSQLLQTFLKAAILTRGNPIVVSREVMARGERGFRLKIENLDDGFFRLSLCDSPDEGSPGLQVPKDSPVWTP